MNMNLIVILGPTASGKTKLAARLAKDRGGEIISADSRQVYRGLDIGTGKDYGDYLVEGEITPHHLIDIIDPDYEFSVFDYQERFFACFTEITVRQRLPILVGGTGLYLDAVLHGYKMSRVPENQKLRAELQEENVEALINRLRKLKPALHNKTDLTDKARLIRAIEIAEYSPLSEAARIAGRPSLKPVVFGLRWQRPILRERITTRLKERLAAGMIEEVRQLHATGVCSWEKMNYFGLEYRYVSLYLQGLLDYHSMLQQLNTKIHQFAKRQETWFRRMERQGVLINWLEDPSYEKLQQQLERLQL